MMFGTYHKVSSFKPLYLIRRFVHPFSGKKRRNYVLNSPLVIKRYKFVPRQQDLDNLYNIPVFIISYNRLSYIKQMVEHLRKYGMNNIHIIDNQSSYPPLLKYLKKCPATVHYMDKNYGHMVFWNSHKFDDIIKHSVYIVTDPDIELNDNLPDTWIEQMYRLLGEYRNITKVGFALRTDDLPNDANGAKDYEKRYWEKPIQHENLELYQAFIDTTFAMYRPGIIHGAGNSFLSGIRVAGDFVARHLPWYIKPSQETAEEKYYRTHADIKISSWIRCTSDTKHSVNHCRALVSVVIPVYNTKPQYIKEAIDSVRAQTFPSVEIIVVNDGSTDKDTLSYLNTLKKTNIKLLNKKNGGLSDARNAGIKVSTGKYILPLDSDDKIAPTYIEHAVKVLEKKSKVGIVYCHAEYFGARTGEWRLADFSTERIKYDNMIFCSAIYRKSDWEKYGGYNTDMIYGLEDWDFWLYFIEDGKTAYKLNDVSFFYRQHHTSSMVADLRNNYRKTRYSILKIVSHHIKIYDDFDKLFKLIYPCECVCGPYRNRNKFIENIFSIKNNQTCTYKIITVLWIKIPIKRGNKQ